MLASGAPLMAPAAGAMLGCGACRDRRPLRALWPFSLCPPRRRRPSASAGLRAGCERGRAAVAVLGLFAVATAWVLWPLARHGADHVLDVHRFYGPAGWFMAADPWLCMWILGWDTHALLTAPTRLFDANIFHPAPLTLALSEHLLGYWPLFAPVYLLTGNPVAGYAVTLLLSFVLSGAAMCALVRHWTGSWAAGVVAGFVFAFAPWRLTQLAHVQFLGLYGLPRVLLFWDRALATGRVRDLAGLGAAFLVQCLCSYYLAYCTVVVTATYAALTAPGVSPRRSVTATAAVGLAAGVVAVVSLPYVWVRASGLLPEQALVTQAAMGVPSWRNYVSPISIGPAIRPYQGRVALALAALGLLAAVPRRGHRATPALALAVMLVAGYLLAHGPTRGGPSLYESLWRWLPGFSVTRVPARFVILVGFAVAGLAGIGTGVLVGRLPAAAGWALGAAYCALVAWDLGLPRFALPLVPVDPLPPVYGWLAEHGEGQPLLELPGRGWRGDILGTLREQRYAWSSLRHWLPELTGRSGYFPPNYELVQAIAHRLPDPTALDTLVRLTGLRWLVVHGADMPWDDRPVDGLELAAAFGSDRVYRVDRGRPDWEAELVRRLGGGAESTTFAGTPLRQLPARDLRAQFVRFDVPGPRPPRLPVPVTITVRNRARRTWPGLALATGRLVLVRAQWRGAGGRQVAPTLPALRLTADAPPGAEVGLSALVPAPAAPGHYRLILRVMQGRAVGGRAVRALEVVER